MSDGLPDLAGAVAVRRAWRAALRRLIYAPLVVGAAGTAVGFTLPYPFGPGLIGVALGAAEGMMGLLFVIELLLERHVVRLLHPSEAPA